MQTTVDRYLKLYAQRIRPASVAIKRGNLRRLIRFLHQQYPRVRCWRDVCRVPHIEDWMQSLLDASLKANTRLLHIGTVALFFDDTARWQWPEAPPPGLLHPEDRPRQEHHLPTPFPPEVDHAVQKALAQQQTLPAMALFLQRLTGMRSGEMRDLPLQAIAVHQTGPGTLHIPMGKTRAERVVPLNEQAVQLIHAIQLQRGSQLGAKPMPEDSVSYLMVQPNGRRLTRKRCAVTLKQIAQPLLPSEHVHPHRLRHTYATEMIRAGMSVQVLMKILGHVNTAMTMRYVEVTADDLRRDYQKAISRLKVLDHIQLPEPAPTAINPGHLQDILQILITRIESLHRDRIDTHLAPPLRRFVKRLRKTKGDLLALLEKMDPAT